MNQNDNPEVQFSAQLDHLLSGGAATGIPAADDLARTIPAASTTFQQSLETRLIAEMQLHQNGEGDETMVTLPLVRNATASRGRLIYLPLTLAAAMVAIALVGSVLIFGTHRGTPPNLAVVQESTLTPTPAPVPLLNIVVSLRDLPRGFQFPYTIGELSDIVGYAVWPESAVPAAALLQDQNGLEQLLGRIVRTNLFREQPILTNLLVDDLTQIADVGSAAAIILPQDRVVVSVPVDQLTVDVGVVIRAGDHIDLSGDFLFTDVDEEFQSVIPPPIDIAADIPNIASTGNCSEQTPCQVTQTVIRDAIVAHIGDFGETSSDNPPDIITLAVSPDEAPILVWLIESKIPLTLELTEACSALLGSPCINAAQLPSYPGVIPQGMLLSHIPFDSISNDLSSIHEGDLVDVTFSFLREAFERQDANTASPVNGHIDTRTVLTGVKVYRMGDSMLPSQKDVVTLLLTHADGALLLAIMSGNTPIAITLTRADEGVIATEKLQDGRVSINVPAISLISDDTTSGTVNILAQMVFTNYNPEDLGSVGLEGEHPVTHILSQDAEIIGTPDEETYTLSVALEDIELLQWALKSGLPLTLEHHPE